jgi:replicative DNA helicase
MVMQNAASYGHNFQNKVIYSLLTDRIFLQNISDLLTVEYFENVAHKWIVNQVISYFSKYHTHPTPEVIKVEMKKEKNEVLRVAIREELKQAYGNTEEDIQYVKEEFFDFCKNQRLKEALLKSVDLLQAGEYDDIRRLIDNAIKSGSDRNVGHEYNKDIETRFREEERNVIPFPWEVLNNITDGGYGSGDLVIFFAGPGAGKSWVVASMGAIAAKMGKKVLHYTLELSDIYVGKRYDSLFTGIDFKKLKFHRNEVDKALSDLPGQIVIKSYSPKRASLETIEAHIRQLKNVSDFIPDMVIIDYPDLLRASKIRKEAREETDDIYTEIKGLAKDLGIPFVCPSQINRMGAKDDIIEADKISGSYGKIMIADIGISLSRKRKDKINGTGRFHVMKNRYGGDGMTYPGTIDMNNGKIELSDEEYDESESDDNDTMDSEEMNIIRKKFRKINND